MSHAGELTPASCSAVRRGGACRRFWWPLLRQKLVRLTRSAGGRSIDGRCGRGRQMTEPPTRRRVATAAAALHLKDAVGKRGGRAVEHDGPLHLEALDPHGRRAREDDEHGRVRVALAAQHRHRGLADGSVSGASLCRRRGAGEHQLGAGGEARPDRCADGERLVGRHGELADVEIHVDRRIERGGRLERGADAVDRRRADDDVRRRRRRRWAARGRGWRREWDGGRGRGRGRRGRRRRGLRG